MTEPRSKMGLRWEFAYKSALFGSGMSILISLIAGNPRWPYAVANGFFTSMVLGFAFGPILHEAFLRLERPRRFSPRWRHAGQPPPVFAKADMLTPLLDVARCPSCETMLRVTNPAVGVEQPIEGHIGICGACATPALLVVAEQVGSAETFRLRPLTDAERAAFHDDPIAEWTLYRLQHPTRPQSGQS